MAQRGTYTTTRLWRKLKPTARALRSGGTDAERLLWERLQNRRLGGIKFRRQHPIDRFVADFCAPAEWLVIELDGAAHEGRGQEDATRQARIEQLGFRVLRFSNDAVQQQIDSVLETIRQAIASMH